MAIFKHTAAVQDTSAFLCVSMFAPCADPNQHKKETELCRSPSGRPALFLSVWNQHVAQDFSSDCSVSRMPSSSSSRHTRS